VKIHFTFDNDGDHDKEKNLVVILVSVLVIVAELGVIALLLANIFANVKVDSDLGGGSNAVVDRGVQVFLLGEIEATGRD